MGVNMQPANFVVVGVLVPAIQFQPQPLILGTCPAQHSEPFRTPPQSPAGAPMKSFATEVQSSSTVAPDDSQGKRKKGSNARRENPIPILKQGRWLGQIALFPMKRQLREALAAAEREKAAAERENASASH